MKQIWYALAIAVTLLQPACGGGDDFPDAAPPSDVAAVIPNTTIAPQGRIVRTRDVTLTADVPATIYYTLDDTEPTTASTSGPSPLTFTLPGGGAIVRWFAVSSTGGTEPSKTETLIVDRLGPDAIDSLTATATGADVALSWINPTTAGFADVVIVRTPDVAATVPTDGAPLAVGDSVGPGTVVYVGAATSFTHVGAGAGASAYVAWARFGNGVLAEGRTAAAYVEPPAQLATIAIDITAKTGSVTTQPSAYTLAIANVSTAVPGQVSFDVTATTTLRGITFAPKLVQKSLAITDDTSVDLVPDGTLGTAGTTSVVALGVALTAAGALTRTVTINTGGTGVITFEVEVVHSPGAFAPTWQSPGGDHGGGVFADLGSTVELDALPDPTPWDNTTRAGLESGQYRQLTVSPDGRWLYAGQRAANRVVKIDTTTGEVVAGTDLPLAVAGSRASVAVELDPSGHRLYAVFNDGMHAGAYKSTLDALQAPLPTTVSSYFLEIDPTTMAEVGRLALQADAQALRVARNFALSRDGRKAAIPVGGSFSDADDAGVALVDVAPMFLRDGDLQTAGTQLVATPGFRPVRCAFTWTGDRVVCLHSTYNFGGDHVSVITTAGLTLTSGDQDGASASNTHKYKAVIALPDGAMALAGQGTPPLDGPAEGTPLVTFAPATRVFTVVGSAPLPQVLGGYLSGPDLVMRSFRELFRVDRATGTATLLHAQASQANTHTVAATPF